MMAVKSLALSCVMTILSVGVAVTCSCITADASAAPSNHLSHQGSFTLSSVTTQTSFTGTNFATETLPIHLVTGLVFDPLNNYIYVGDSTKAFGLNSTTGVLSENLSGFASPILYDGYSHLLYMLTSNGSFLTSINAKNSTAYNLSMKLRAGPMLLNKVTSQIAVVPAGGPKMLLINTTTNSIEATANNISFEAGAYDPFVNAFFILTRTANGTGVSVLNATSLQYIGNISGSDVSVISGGICYDTQNRAIYVANLYPGQVTELDPSTGKVMANISVGVWPTSIVVDSFTHNLYVTVGPSNPMIRVIDVSRNVVIHTIQLTQLANLDDNNIFGEVYNNITHGIYVAGWGPGNASVAMISSQIYNFTSQGDFWTSEPGILTLGLVITGTTLAIAGAIIFSKRHLKR